MLLRLGSPSQMNKPYNGIGGTVYVSVHQVEFVGSAFQSQPHELVNGEVLDTNTEGVYAGSITMDLPFLGLGQESYVQNNGIVLYGRVVHPDYNGFRTSDYTIRDGTIVDYEIEVLDINDVVNIYGIDETDADYTAPGGSNAIGIQMASDESATIYAASGQRGLALKPNGYQIGDNLKFRFVGSSAQSAQTCFVSKNNGPWMRRCIIVNMTLPATGRTKFCSLSQGVNTNVKRIVVRDDEHANLLDPVVLETFDSVPATWENPGNRRVADSSIYTSSGKLGMDVKGTNPANNPNLRWWGEDYGVSVIGLYFGITGAGVYLDNNVLGAWLRGAPDTANGANGILVGGDDSAQTRIIDFVDGTQNIRYSGTAISQGTISMFLDHDNELSLQLGTGNTSVYGIATAAALANNTFHGVGTNASSTLVTAKNTEFRLFDGSPDMSGVL